VPSPLIEVQDSFAGGLSLTGDPFATPVNGLQLAQNWRVTAGGALQKRSGSTRSGVSSLSISASNSGFTWFQGASNLTTELVATGISPVTLYKRFTFSDTDWVSMGTLNIWNPSFASFTHGAGSPAVYIADLSNSGILRYTENPSTLSARVGTSAPNVSFLCTYNRRLYGVNAFGRLFWSDLDDGDTLGDAANGGGFVDVVTNQPGSTTGLLAVGSSLIIFHNTGISRWTGWTIDDFAVDPRGLSVGVGCIAPKSIVQVSQDFGVFFGSNGIYRITENGIELISAPIEAAVREVLDQGNASTVWAAHNSEYQEVWFGMGSNGTKIYAWNYLHNAWFGPMNIVGKTGCIGWTGVVIGTAGPQFVPMVGYTDGFIRYHDSVYDLKADDKLQNGTGGGTIVAQAVTRRFTYGQPTTTKALRRLFVTGNFASSADFAVGVGSNLQATTNQYTFPALDGSDRTLVWNGGGRGAWFEVLLRDADATFRPTISAVQLDAFRTPRQGF